ncbi:MAG: peroxin [Watsoniomyces obsoletus]|nr:MAG: peroxin [Watsoniomyces obsoletus]
MLAATRRWFRRNRTPLTIGLGVLGAGYVATQYVLTKFAEARERSNSEHVSRENLRRRFEQNQEDCTFTVLALLPTATENILEALPVEKITHELQQKKAERLARSIATTKSDTPISELGSDPPSVVVAGDDDGKSLRSFQSESYVHASQAGDGKSTTQEQDKPKKSKAQLWMELKITSVTRTFTLIYTLALLTLLTRIQLNLLGRRNYLSSVISLAYHNSTTTPGRGSTISLENREDISAENAYEGDFEANRRYLTFSWWLLHRGWRDVMKNVEAVVKEVFGPLDPREDLSLKKVAELTLEVRRRVEGRNSIERRNRKWLPYLLPPHDQEESVLQESGILSSSSTSLNLPPSTSPTTAETTTRTTNTTLRRLLDETADLIDSPTFTHVLTGLLDAGFSLLVDIKIAEQAFKQSPLPPNPNPTTSPSEPSQSTESHDEEKEPKKAKLANILAVITRQAHNISNTNNIPSAPGGGDIRGNGSGMNTGNGIGMGNGSNGGAMTMLSNEYLSTMESQCKDLEGFAAVIYSSNFEVENPLLLDGEDSSRGGRGGRDTRSAGDDAPDAPDAAGGIGRGRGDIGGGGNKKRRNEQGISGGDIPEEFQEKGKGEDLVKDGEGEGVSNISEVIAHVDGSVKEEESRGGKEKKFGNDDDDVNQEQENLESAWGKATA